MGRVNTFQVNADIVTATLDYICNGADFVELFGEERGEQLNNYLDNMSEWEFWSELDNKEKTTICTEAYKWRYGS